MTLTLTQKLMSAIIILTIIYSTLIFLVYYDMMRKLNKSVVQLLPGIIVFCFGIAANSFFKNPDFIFDQLLPIKSGFARGIIGLTIFPFVGASLRTLTVIGGLSLLIDKMWFYWQAQRISFVIRMTSVVAMAIIMGNTLFKFVFSEQKEIPLATKNLNIISASAGSFLGALLLLVTIMAIPHIFAKDESDTNS